MMSNDENESIQQSLPLSWEDSEPDLQEQPPKKLLLRREEFTDTELNEEENELDETVDSEEDDMPEAHEDPVEEQIHVQKPILLKKATENEPEDEYLEDVPEDEYLEDGEQIHVQKPILLKKATEGELEDRQEGEPEDEYLEDGEQIHVQKPILLKKATEGELEDRQEGEPEDEYSEDEVNEDRQEGGEQIHVQKPLLLKNVEEEAARLNEDDKATVIDDRFYGKSQIDIEDFSDYEDDAHLNQDDKSDDDIEENSLEEDFGDELEEEEVLNKESRGNLEEDSEKKPQDEYIKEQDLNEEFDQNQDSDSENDLEEDFEDELEEEILKEDSYLGLEKENSLDEEKGEAAFADTGTFTLDDDYQEPEEDEEENRLSIPEDVLDDFEEEREDAKEELEEEISNSIAENPSDEEEKSLSEKIEEQQEGMTAEESVFALKADTYYDHTDIESTKDNSSIDSPPIETPEDAEVFQHEDQQSLGEMLQEARLACSFTIKDAAEATRIKSSYIISLESNEFHELPAKVYILNYIRQLCREYNIAHEPVIKQYEKQADDNNNGEVKVVRVGDEDARRATKPNSKLNALVVGSSLLVFGILIFTAWTMQWFGPANSADAVKDVEINLIEVRSGVTLPSPELPVPTR